MPFLPTCIFASRCSRSSTYSRDFLLVLQHLPIGEAFLTRLHTDPDFNDTFRPWLAGLPARGNIFGPEAWSDAEVRMLQGGALVRPCNTPLVTGQASPYVLQSSAH